MLRVVTLVTVLIGTLLATPSLAGEDGYDRIPIAVDVTIGPDDDTRCRIVGYLYRPHGATRGDPAPAILTTHGFGGSRDSGDQRAIGAGFAGEGYVVLSYSGLGFGGSECKIHLDDPDWDGKAGSQLVEVLAGTRPATNTDTGEPLTVDFVRLDSPGDPRVGMVGGSYGGQIQYAVAAVSQKVDALAPIVTWNDLSYSLAPNNTDFADGVSSGTPGVHKKQWTSFFFGAGIVDGAEGATVDPDRMVGCPNFHDPICPAKAKLDALGYPDEETVALARHASVASYIDRIHAPTLLLQAQVDTLFNLQEAVATYRSLKRQGTPVSMIWHSEGHSGGAVPGELALDPENPRGSYLGARIADWFDHWLRGDETAPAGPEFSYFRDWVYRATGSVRQAYATSKGFPVGHGEPLYLTGTDSLTADRSAVEPGEQSFTTPAGGAPTSYSETSALEGNTVNNPPSDAPGSFAAWTTAPLARPLSIVGSPTLRVRLSAPTAERSQASGPAGMLVLFAKIYDIAPDGSKTLQHRLISPVRVPDVRDPLRIELPAVVQRFPAGHRIQLVLAGGDAAYAGNALAHPVTVLTDDAHPGVLELPVLGAPPRTGTRR